jgi:hypothetical protein
MPAILGWIGSSGIKREHSAGTLDAVAEKNPWHANINKPFDNRDADKLKNLTFYQSFIFHATRSFLHIANSLSRKARVVADQRQMTSLRQQAADLLRKP